MVVNSKFKIQNSKFIICILILLTAAMLNYYFSKPDISLSRKSLTEFPKTLGGWTVISDHQIDESSMKILQVDDYLMRNYENSDGDVIGLYIGYFKSQREGKGIHSPRQCLPGSGWAPVETSIYKLPVESLHPSLDSTFNTYNSKLDSPYNSTLKTQHSRLNPSIIQVNKSVMSKGLERQLFLFWYQGRGRNYNSEYWNKVYLIWDGLTKKRTDGALVRLNSVMDGDSEAALNTQTEFIKIMFPLLKEYIPD